MFAIVHLLFGERVGKFHIMWKRGKIPGEFFCPKDSFNFVFYFKLTRHWWKITLSFQLYKPLCEVTETWFVEILHSRASGRSLALLWPFCHTPAVHCGAGVEMSHQMSLFLEEFLFKKKLKDSFFHLLKAMRGLHWRIKLNRNQIGKTRWFLASEIYQFIYSDNKCNTSIRF